MATKTTSRPLPDVLEDIDREIEAAAGALWVANDFWRNLGPSGPVDLNRAGPSHNPSRRMAKLRAGIAVDEAIAKVENLRKLRAQTELDHVDDPMALARLEAAAASAEVVFRDAEMHAREARSACAAAKAALDSRRRRVVDLRSRIAEHGAKVNSAEAAATREREELAQLERFQAMRAAMATSPEGGERW